MIFVALSATVGARIGEASGTTSTSRALLFVFAGAGIGYVIGGVFGRLTLRAVHGLESELGKKPPAVLAGGVVGLLVGLLVAGLMMIPLLFLPASASWPAIVFLYLTFGTLGYRLGQAKYEDIFGLVGIKPRAAGVTRGDLHVLDTSALIDGRVADLVATGFVAGTVLLHEGVLRELQAISDSSDPHRRTRGRRGLDMLVELQKAPTLQFQLVEEAGVMDVDAALVRLARERGAQLITVDHNLAKVAEALRVPVAQINALRIALPRPVHRRRRARGPRRQGRPRARPSRRLPRRRHDGGRRAGGRADRLAGRGPRDERDPDDHRPDDLRRALGRLPGDGRRRRLNVSVCDAATVEPDAAIVILLGAGAGRRLGGAEPKALLPIGGRPIARGRRGRSRGRSLRSTDSS